MSLVRGSGQGAVVGEIQLLKFCFAGRIRLRRGSAGRLRCVGDTLQFLLSNHGGQESGPGFFLSDGRAVALFVLFEVCEGGLRAVFGDKLFGLQSVWIASGQVSKSAVRAILVVELEKIQDCVGSSEVSGTGFVVVDYFVDDGYIGWVKSECTGDIFHDSPLWCLQPPLPALCGTTS